MAFLNGLSDSDSKRLSMGMGRNRHQRDEDDEYRRETAMRLHAANSVSRVIAGAIQIISEDKAATASVPSAPANVDKSDAKVDKDNDLSAVNDAECGSLGSSVHAPSQGANVDKDKDGDLFDLDLSSLDPAQSFDLIFPGMSAHKPPFPRTPMPSTHAPEHDQEASAICDTGAATTADLKHGIGSTQPPFSSQRGHPAESCSTMVAVNTNKDHQQRVSTSLLQSTEEKKIFKEESESDNTGVCPAPGKTHKQEIKRALVDCDILKEAPVNDVSKMNLDFSLKYKSAVMPTETPSDPTRSPLRNSGYDTVTFPVSNSKFFPQPPPNTPINSKTRNKSCLPDSLDMKIVFDPVKSSTLATAESPTLTRKTIFEQEKPTGVSWNQSGPNPRSSNMVNLFSTAKSDGNEKYNIQQNVVLPALNSNASLMPTYRKHYVPIRRFSEGNNLACVPLCQNLTSASREMSHKHKLRKSNSSFALKEKRKPTLSKTGTMTGSIDDNFGVLNPAGLSLVPTVFASGVTSQSGIGALTKSAEADCYQCPVEIVSTASEMRPPRANKKYFLGAIPKSLSFDESKYGLAKEILEQHFPKLQKDALDGSRPPKYERYQHPLDVESIAIDLDQRDNVDGITAPKHVGKASDGCSSTAGDVVASGEAFVTTPNTTRKGKERHGKLLHSVDSYPTFWEAEKRRLHTAIIQKQRNSGEFFAHPDIPTRISIADVIQTSPRLFKKRQTRDPKLADQPQDLGLSKPSETEVLKGLKGTLGQSRNIPPYGPTPILSGSGSESPQIPRAQAARKGSLDNGGDSIVAASPLPVVQTTRPAVQRENTHLEQPDSEAETHNKTALLESKILPQKRATKKKAADTKGDKPRNNTFLLSKLLDRLPSQSTVSTDTSVSDSVFHSDIHRSQQTIVDDATTADDCGDVRRPSLDRLSERGNSGGQCLLDVFRCCCGIRSASSNDQSEASQ